MEDYAGAIANVKLSKSRADEVVYGELGGIWRRERGEK